MPTPERALSCGALIVAWLCLFPTIPSSQASSAQALSTPGIPAYGNCPAPQNAGVRVCGPFIFSGVTAIASPFQLIASGTGARGSVNFMQLWADGVKLQTVFANVFDAPVTLSSGTHQLTVVEIDTTGAFLKSAPISMSIEGNTAEEACPAPTSPGVNACVPGVNSCHTAGWTTIIASGTGATGVVRRMEMWVDGVKLANFPGNRINTNLYLNDFSTVTIVEVDSAGGFAKSPPMVIQSC